MSEVYDRLGRGYAAVRREDEAIAARIDAALGDARSVVNVGAGAGSYEPPGREVLAVEPAAEMIAQRPPDAAPAVQARAEELPFEDGRFDAAMAVLTVHHWADPIAGLREMRRVAHRRVLVVTFDPGPLHRLWITTEYFPEVARMHESRVPAVRLAEAIGAIRSESLPVRRECTDLFFAALWGRPEMLLDDEVVGPMWIWSMLSAEARKTGRERLAADLESGAWDERHGAPAPAGGARRRAAPAGRRAGRAEAPAGRMAAMEGLQTPLEGSIVALEPLSEDHAEGLWEAAQAPETWSWLFNLGESREMFELWLRASIDSASEGQEGPYATRRLADGVVLGSSRYLNVRPGDRVVEVGWTWLRPDAWGTGANVEAKLLMMEHAFERLDCVRVEFKTDSRNERSRAALAALPAKFEGVLRKHMIIPGIGQRDSAYYSVVDDEWPRVRSALEARLRGG